MQRKHAMLLGAAGLGGLALAGRAWLRHSRKISLAGRVVVVTGSSTGFGLVIARQAAEQGAKVVLAARGEETLRAAEAELTAIGGEVLAVPTDLADEDQARNLIDRAVERFGRVDVLVNNAGIIQVGPAETMTVDDFRKAMETNFWGEVYTTLAVLPHMRSQGFGRIANVVSVGGRFAVPHLLPYVASKFALTGFSEGLRSEIAKDNILVTGVYPGTMRTGGHAHAEFKGNPRAEYTWFALSDTLPVMSVSVSHAARSLWNAVMHGDPEVVIGWNAKLAVILHNLLPDWTVEALSLVNRAMPKAKSLDGPSIKGKDLSGFVPDLLNKMIPAGTRPQAP